MNPPKLSQRATAVSSAAPKDSRGPIQLRPGSEVVPIHKMPNPLLFLGAGFALVSALVLFWFDPVRYGFYPVCVFYRTTGFLCPGCGSLRAVHQLLNGHFAAAFRFNAFLVCSLPFFGWLAVRLAVLKMHHQPATVSIRPIWLWAILVALLVFGVVRNLPFAEIVGLAP